ncbi:MAG: hypothetical protein WCI04_04355 [archaeon]
MASGPTSIIHKRRAALFDPSTILPNSRAPRTLAKMPRGKVISNTQDTKRGINIALLKTAKNKIERTGNYFRHRHYPPKDVLLWQSLELDSLASHFADHALESSRRENAVNSDQRTAKLAGTKSQSEIESKLWEGFYQGFMKTFLKRNPDLGKNVLSTLSKIRIFLRVPHFIIQERKRHSNKINAICEKLIEGNADPEQNLLNETNDIIIKHFTMPHVDKAVSLRLAAMDLMTAATIYADLTSSKYKEKIEGEKNKSEFWNYAYGDAMQKIYLKIGGDEELVNCILNFNKDPKRS